MKKYNLKFSKSIAALVVLATTMTVLLFIGLQSNSDSPNFNEEEIAKDNSNEALFFSEFYPLPPPEKYDENKVNLGNNLFHDVRLSSNNTISCSSCHQLNHGGVDGRQFSVGVGGKLGIVNAPTVFNSRWNFKHFWDGRAASLKDQIEGPIHNPLEMATNWEDVITKLQADKKQKLTFEKIYSDGINQKNIIDAIVTFENTLVTENSPFDLYLKGDDKILTSSQLAGFQKFKSFGCAACHQGINIGGNMYQALGIAKNYFADRGGFYISDLGRFNVTGNESDRGVFRVPSLRNVELTAPYFHDGYAKDLDQAVVVMAKYQLGRKLSAKDRLDLVAFLKSLTGQMPQSLSQRKVANEKSNQ